MEYKINGQIKELKFGVGFVRKLDDIYKVNMNGIEFGAGLVMANMQLAQMNPTALSDVIKCAVAGQVTQREVDNFIDDYAEDNGGLKSLFNELEDEMGKSLVVKDTIAQMEEAQENLQEEED